MCEHCMTRREFATVTAAGLASGLFVGRSLAAANPISVQPWDPDQPFLTAGRPLRVQPILAHNILAPREKTSWRSWSEIITETAAAEELQRISAELKTLNSRAGFPLEMLPPAKVTTVEQAAEVQAREFDVALLYAASNAKLFQPCCAAAPTRDTIVFVRHKSGPTYYGYECLGVRFFKTPGPEVWRHNSLENHGPVTLDDVVVDDYEEVLWRMRALYGLKNLVGQRVVALGGPQGKYDPTAPEVARQRFGLQIIDVSYDELADRLHKLLGDEPMRELCRQWTERYLAMPSTVLETKRDFIERAFCLYLVFRQWLVEHAAPAITINSCMGAILSATDTTACLPLSWLNDEGHIALCESDFVIVPAAILLRYIAETPVFMHNSTFPHNAMVTCAHCTAPRRMDGRRYEPARIMTHYESDFGAAPKIEMPIGQTVCAISPEYASGRWVGIRGTVRDNPCFAICRSQQDVEIQGQWKRLIAETRDSHWMMAYGDFLREIGYAARKIGLTWDDISSGDV